MAINKDDSQNDEAPRPENPQEGSSNDTDSTDASKDNQRPKNTFSDFLNNLRDMIASGNVHVETIMAEPPPIQRERRRSSPNAKREEASALKRIKSFSLTPHEIHDYLDKFVISQDQAKRALAVAVCDHYNYIRRCINGEVDDSMDINHAKHNVLMMGPTGVGKTYIMRCLAQLIGVPFVKADATKYTETGYVGYDVEDIIRDLIKAANGNVRIAQYGIVYIDEIDKLARQGGDGHRDVSGRGVQVNLLKMMEDTEVKVVSQTDMMGQMRMAMAQSDQPTTIRTKNILFIVSGAFDKLDEIIRKRMGNSIIGFGHLQNDKSSRTDAEILSEVETHDLVEYGFEPEFVGRLPVRVALKDLCQKDLEKILTGVSNNYIQQYQEAFLGYGIELNVTQDAIREIARQAAEEKTGARGLLTILERTFRNFKYELPSTEIKSLTVDEAVVKDPKKGLENALLLELKNQMKKLNESIKEYCEDFKSEYGFTIEISPDTIAQMIKQTIETDFTPEEILKQALDNLPHALHLIHHPQETPFTVTPELLKNPKEAIDKMIQDSLKK